MSTRGLDRRRRPHAVVARAIVRASVLLALLAGCDPGETPPDGQLLLYVTTDAPLPAAAGQPAADPPALFDRLRIEIFPATATAPCRGCTREFGIDQELVDAGRASIGVVPEPGAQGVRARIRMFRSGGTISGEPRSGSTLETVVALPPTAEEGKDEITVTLWTDDVAHPIGTLDDPVPPALGPPAPGLVGTWSGAARLPCTGTPGPKEVCIPGGAFWMGNPRLDLSAAAEKDGQLERLVVVSPYFLDRAERTVPEFRASGLAVYLSPGQPSNNPHEAGQSIPHCTYTTEPGPYEAFPVNCISWHLAAEYCESVGKRLPHEVELEYAASGLGRSDYVWGNDEPRCTDAVFGRGTVNDDCDELGLGSAPAGTGIRDRLAMAEGEVLDLGGNLAEWALDRWNHETEPCWPQGLLFDPLCDSESPTDGAGRVLRGGHWDHDGWSLQAAIRTWLAFERNAVAAQLGFRCARPDD